MDKKKIDTNQQMNDNELEKKLIEDFSKDIEKNILSFKQMVESEIEQCEKNNKSWSFKILYFSQVILVLILIGMCAYLGYTIFLIPENQDGINVISKSSLVISFMAMFITMLNVLFRKSHEPILHKIMLLLSLNNTINTCSTKELSIEKKLELLNAQNNIILYNSIQKK